MLDDTDNPNSDDALDRTIHDAMRVDIDEQRLERLSQFWQVASVRKKRRNTRRIVATAAAAVALAATVSLVWNRDAGQHEQVNVVPMPANEIVASQSAEITPVESDKSKDRVENSGRGATAYERFVFTARTGVITHKNPATPSIDDVIRQLVADASLNPAEVLESSGITGATAEALVLRRIPRAPVAEYSAILGLLAVCGSQRSVPCLLRLARDEALRTESLSTLEQIVGVDGLAQVVKRSTDRNVRSALMLRLLAADTHAGLLRYLSLVENESTRGEALAVLNSAPRATIDRLMALLDDSDEPVRVTAAIALAKINRPETTQMLISRVIEQPGSSCEAWLALMECRDETAREFLDYATNRPQLLGYYNNARVRRAQLIP